MSVSGFNKYHRTEASILQKRAKRFFNSPKLRGANLNAALVRDWMRERGVPTNEQDTIFLIMKQKLGDKLHETK